MKTYQGASGYRILRDSKIEQFSGGDWQICYDGMHVISNDDYCAIHLVDAGGHVARLELGAYGRKLAEKLTKETEARYN